MRRVKVRQTVAQRANLATLPSRTRAALVVHSKPAQTNKQGD
jgi:hypothetical protein